MTGLCKKRNQPNPEKLQVKYPCVKFIKKRLRKNDDVAEHQVANFDRRVRDNAFLLQIIEYTQELYEKAKKRELDDEEKRLDEILRCNHYTMKNQEQEIDELKAKIEELESQLDVYK